MFELFGTKAPIVTDLADQIRSADWNYEFSDDERRQEKGRKAMDRLEQHVYDFWKKEPEKAVMLWNTHAPCGSKDKMIVPEFITRKQLFDH